MARLTARHPILAGAAIGLLWGVAIRAWMRFITTHPEFSWEGTGFILGAAVLAGTVLGVSWWRWGLGRGNWWRLNGLGVLGLGAGAGIIMMPSVLLGAMAIARTSWHRLIRLGLVMLAVGVQFSVLADLPRDRVVPAALIYLALLGAEAAAVAIVFRPSRIASPAADIRAPLPIDAGG